MANQIKDISNEIVTFEGEIVRGATRWEPAERRDVECRVADALNREHVFLVYNNALFIYTDENFDDAPAEALKALLAGVATDSQRIEINQWLDENAIGSEAKVWAKITNIAQEKYFEG